MKDSNTSFATELEKQQKRIAQGQELHEAIEKISEVSRANVSDKCSAIIQCLERAADYANDYEDNRYFDRMVALIKTLKSFSDRRVVLKIKIAHNHTIIAKVAGFGRSDLLESLVDLLREDGGIVGQDSLYLLEGEDGNNPLANALKAGDANSIEILLNAGATSIKIENIEGIVDGLHKLFCDHKIDLVKKIFTLLPEDKIIEIISSKGDSGQTILHRLVKNKDIGSSEIEVLISLIPELSRAGIINSKDNEGKTALDYSNQREPSALTFGLKHKSRTSTVLEKDSLYLLEGEDGNNPLANALKAGDANSIEILLNAGATSIKIENIEGIVDGLHKLFCDHKIDLVKKIFTLLSEDKIVEIISSKDDSGQTILHRLVKNKDIGSSEIEVLTNLIPEQSRAGIINLKDNDGKTALYYSNQRKPSALTFGLKQESNTSKMLKRYGAAADVDTAAESVAERIVVKPKTDKQKAFEECQFEVSGILHDLNKQILILEDDGKQEQEKSDARQLFNARLFELKQHLYYQNSTDFHALIGLDSLKSHDAESYKDKIGKCDVKELIGFVKTYKKRFEDEAKSIGCYNPMRKRLVDIATKIPNQDDNYLIYCADGNIAINRRDQEDGIRISIRLQDATFTDLANLVSTFERDSKLQTLSTSISPRSYACVTKECINYSIN